MPRIEGPADHSDLRALRERLNRIDRADDIAEWRGELQAIALQLSSHTRNNNIVYRLRQIIERMR